MSYPPSFYQYCFKDKQQIEDNFKKFKMRFVPKIKSFIDEIQPGASKKMDTIWFEYYYYMVHLRNDGMSQNLVLNFMKEIILEQYPLNFIATDKLEKFNDVIETVYGYTMWTLFPKFQNSKYKIHYCGNPDCNGDCGELACGCIDCCRCEKYNRY